jgi:hypothetical protein
MGSHKPKEVKVRRAWHDVFQPLKVNNCQPRLLFPVKLSFIIKEEIKTFLINKSKAIHDH